VRQCYWLSHNRFSAPESLDASIFLSTSWSHLYQGLRAATAYENSPGILSVRRFTGVLQPLDRPAQTQFNGRI